MKKRQLRTLITVLLVAAAGWYWLAPHDLQQGPDISLLGIDGTELRLASYRGKPLLVTFWATTCQTCLREMPQLIQLYRELSPRGLEIIGIAMAYDPPNRVLALREDRQIPYPVALDIHSDAARAFDNVQLTPTTFLIAPDGHVAWRKTGELDMTELRTEILGMLQHAGTDMPCNATFNGGTTCSG
jgi:peroxiredoxin